MKLHYYGKTDKGLKRTTNQDSFRTLPDLNLFIVADGMGGGIAGDMASKIASNEIIKFVQKNRGTVEFCLEGCSEDGIENLTTLLVNALQEANLALYEESVKRRVQGKMGTTATLLLLTSQKAIMVHVGDSRLYRVRENLFSQLSTDHTIAQDYISRYGSTPDTLSGEIAGMLSQAIGIKRYVTPERAVFDILEGDRFILCSDGLSRYLTKGNLALLKNNIFKEPTNDEGLFVKKSVEKLIDFALESGGVDNITVVMASPTKSSSRRQSNLLKELDLIKKCTLFKTLKEDELLQVIEGAELKQLKKYDLLPNSSKGSENDPLFLLLEGQLSLLKQTTHIDTLLPGNHLGALSLFDQWPKEITIFVDKPSVILVIKKIHLLKLISNSPEIGTKLLWELSLSLAKNFKTIFLSL